MEIKKDNIINSCYKLTMSKFMDCLFDNDYSVLGTGTDEELKEAWKAIYNEFSDLRKDNTTVTVFTISKEIELLKCKVSIINECLKVLWVKYDAEIAKELLKLGFAHIRLNPSNKPLYYKQLNDVAGSCKTYQVKLLKKEKELLQLIEQYKGKEASRESFIAINTNLSKYMSFYVDENVITVANWCSMVNNLEKHIEQIEAAKQKKN